MQSKKRHPPEAVPRARRSGAARALLLAVGCLLAAPSFAAGINWGDLTPEQQALLQSKKAEWANLSVQRQETLARGAERWLAMSDEDRARARERLQAWKKMTPEQQQTLLAKREQFRTLAPERQRKLHERHEQFQNLPAEQQREIREAYQQSRKKALDCAKRKADGAAVDCPREALPPVKPRDTRDKDKDALKLPGF